VQVETYDYTIFVAKHYERITAGRPDVEGKHLLRYRLDKWDEKLNVFSWLIMKLNHWLLRPWWRTSGFHKTMYFFIGCVVAYYQFLIFFCDLFYDVIIQRRMLKRWMNEGTGRDFEGSGSSRIQACLEGLRSKRIAGIPGNVRTVHLSNITREHYHDSNLLGPFASQENPAPWYWFFRLIQIFPRSLIAQCKT